MLAHYAALLFRVQTAVSLLFPPSGVAIALAIWFGAPAALVTGMVSTLMAPHWGSHGWAQWVGWTDAIEPLIAWWLYRRVWRRSLTLDRIKDVAAFIVSAPILACAGSAIVGSLALAMIGKMPWPSISTAMLQWWLGNAIGTMAISPIAILVLTPVLQRWGWLPGAVITRDTAVNGGSVSRRFMEKGAIVGICVAIAILSVSQTSQTGFAFQQFAFLNFVPILWAALRFGAIGGASTGGLCVAAALLSYILQYLHVLTTASLPVDPGVLTVHKLSLLVQCIVGLLVGTATTQQIQAQVKLALSQMQIAEYEVRSQLNEQLELINQALTAANAQLEQANRDKDELLLREQGARSQAESANRIKDEFLAIVSHELRTPLNPILGWSKLLQSGSLDPTVTQKALQTIERNATLQSQLIEDLLDVSRILRGKLVLHKMEVDLGGIIRAALETVRLAAEGKAIALTAPPTDSQILVYGDPNRLQQIMVNLLTNAIKFTPNYGQVTVQLEQVTKEEHDLKTQINPDKHRWNDENPGEFPPHLPTSTYAQVRVIDTGKGIHPDFLPYVFERFRQEDSGTTRNFGGLGLGLAIARHLVELHEGQVEAQSEGVDRGATFIIEIPMIQGKGEREKAKGQESDWATLPTPHSLLPTPVLQDKQILVVEDDADARALLQHVLAAQATVVLAASAQEAIAQLRSFTPDLIISDIHMPEMDGYCLMRYLRQKADWEGESAKAGYRIPAIALTANVREEDREKAIAAGFDAHLAKPVDINRLMQEIERLLRPKAIS
ncbi:MAG: MASE1 domain-containing protein [Oculatellaceae cyanobacterium Prado106]|nr:MASE1 domain-containing protein [Oculatellaceae cyanobacterium Prado106]